MTSSDPGKISFHILSEMRDTGAPISSSMGKVTPWWREITSPYWICGQLTRALHRIQPVSLLVEEPSVTSELFAVKRGSPESAIIVEPKVNGFSSHEVEHLVSQFRGMLPSQHSYTFSLCDLRGLSTSTALLKPVIALVWVMPSLPTSVTH